MKKNTTRNLFLKVSFAIILIVWFLHKNNLQVVFLSIRSVPLNVYLVSVFLMFLSLFVNSVKWFLLLPQYNILKLFQVNLIGQFYGLILPGQLLGEGAKAFIFGKGKTDVETIWISVFIDKITGLIALFLLGLTGIILTHKELPLWFTILFIISIAFSLLILFFIRVPSINNIVMSVLNYVSIKFPKLEKIIAQLVRIIDDWFKTTQKTKIIFSSISLGILSQAMGVYINLLLAGSMGIYVSFIDWCWIQAAVSIVLLMPVTIGGIGLREGSFIGLLTWLGISSEKALALSFIIFSLQIIRAIAGAISDQWFTWSKSGI